MIKRTFAFCGLGIFLLGIIIGLYLYAADYKARTLDSSGGFWMPDCFHMVDINVGKRVMSENESQAIKVILTSRYHKQCEIGTYISAPNFDVAPAEHQSVSLPAQPGTATVIWIVTPRKPGTFEIVVYGTIIGITVTTPLGLSPQQAQWLSYIGSFFGPMLTLPWWYEKLRERRSKRTSSKSKSKKR